MDDNKLDLGTDVPLDPDAEELGDELDDLEIDEPVDSAGEEIP